MKYTSVNLKIKFKVLTQISNREHTEDLRFYLLVPFFSFNFFLIFVIIVLLFYLKF